METEKKWIKTTKQDEKKGDKAPHESISRASNCCLPAKWNSVGSTPERPDCEWRQS